MKKVVKDDLNEAIRMGLPLKTIQHLVLNNGCDVNAISPDGYSALIEAIDAQLDDAALFLIEQGADIHFADSRGANALYFAVYNGSWVLFQKLIELGMSPDLKASGWPLINLACSRAHKFKRLNLEVSTIQNGKSTKVTDQTEIDRIAGKDRYQNFSRIVSELLKLGGDINGVETKNRQTPLTLCAGRGDQELIDLLIKADADVNVKDAAGLVALHWATRTGYLGIVTSLLKAGANPNAAEDYGFTPLHEAAENNRPLIAKTLIKAGADKSKGITKGFPPFVAGDTPKEVAKKKGFMDLVEVL